MKLIVGLGNPGPSYQDTRHNVGFAVVDLVAARHGVEFEGARTAALIARLRRFGDGVLLVKPLTFMNLSGEAVAELRRYYRIELADVLVVADDVNLPLGRVRAREEGSDGGHNGLASVIAALGTEQVPRLRIGVGRGDLRRELADHVLARWDDDERPAVETAILRAADAVELFATDGIMRVMNTFNPRTAEQAAVTGNEESETNS